MTNHSKNKNKISILLVGATAFLIVLIALYFFSTNSETEKFIKKKAAEMNNNFPMMIDDETRSDSVVVQGKDTLLFHYTLINFEKENLDIQTLQNRFLPILNYNVKQSKELELLKVKNITFGYTYNDNKRKEIFTFFITPKMYK